MKTSTWFTIGGAIIGCILVLLWYQRLFFIDDNIVRETTNQTYQYAAPWNKEMYEGFYDQSKRLVVDPIEKILGGIIPHHLLAGHVAADLFSALAKQKPKTIVVVSPNHFSRGQGNIITSSRHWQTPFGVVKTDTTVVRTLTQSGQATIDEAVIAEEHGIYGLISFVAKSLPETNVVVFALKESASNETLDRFAAELAQALPKDTPIVASIDFSHYLNHTAATYHDELAANVIRTFDYDRLRTLEIDSAAALRVFLRLMDTVDAKKIAFETRTDAAVLTGTLAAENITSYYSAFFTSGQRSGERPSVSLLHFGDIMLDRNVKRHIDTHGADYVLSALAGEENRFSRGVDIVAANLEGPFVSYKRPTSKEIAFGFDPAHIPMLQKHNFTLFTLANNHSQDMTVAGFEENKKYLRAAGIDFYGEQYAIDEDALFMKEIAGRKIAFIGINDTHWPAAMIDVLPLIDTAKMEADTIIVNVHWGAEYQPVSNARQRKLAHELIDAGADIIIGHHPHVVQEVEIYGDKPIFYSLGNFIFDQYFSRETQEGLGIGLVLHDNATSVYFFPLMGRESQVRRMPYDQAQTFMRALLDRSRLGEYNIEDFHMLL